MMWAKQSTAATLIVGPILDSTGAEYTSAVIGDISLSKNGGTLTALASAATLTYIANGQYTLVLTTGNTDTLGRAQFTCNKSTYQMPPLELMIVASAVYDTLVTNGTLASTTSGRTIVVDAAGLADANTVKLGPSGSGTAQTQKDLGAINVTNLNTLSGHDPGATLGTSTLTQTQVTGGAYSIQSSSCILGDTRIAHLDDDISTVLSRIGSPSVSLTADIAAIQSDTDDIQTRLPASLTSNGNMKSSLQEILSTALTETSGQLAGGFKKFFNVATPASTMDALTLVATATNLTNAPTSGDFTNTMKTSIGTAVAASAVASVTGNVGGTINGMTAAGWAGAFTVDTTKVYADAIAGSVVSEIADNAGGSSLTASDIADEVETRTIAGVTLVGTTTNLTNLPTMPTDWLTAAGLKADAVTEIQSGLASQSSVDTIDTDINMVLTRIGSPGVSITADIAALNDISAADVWANSTRTLTTLSGLTPNDSSGVTTLLSRVTGAVALHSDITALNNLSTADVLAQLETALASTTRSLPGAVTPSATPTIAAALMQIYKLSTNKTDQATDGTQQIYARDGSTVEQVRVVENTTDLSTIGALTSV